MAKIMAKPEKHIVGLLRMHPRHNPGHRDGGTKAKKPGCCRRVVVTLIVHVVVRVLGGVILISCRCSCYC